MNHLQPKHRNQPLEPQGNQQSEPQPTWIFKPLTGSHSSLVSALWIILNHRCYRYTNHKFFHKLDYLAVSHVRAGQKHRQLGEKPKLNRNRILLCSLKTDTPALFFCVSPLAQTYCLVFCLLEVTKWPEQPNQDQGCHPRRIETKINKIMHDGPPDIRYWWQSVKGWLGTTKKGCLEAIENSYSYRLH